MNLLYANPITLAYHYLLLWFYNGTPLENLHSEFSSNDRNAEDTVLQSEYGGTEHTALEFDFIIVGGGSAGCVLANRLSESNATVLLIEAGGNPFPLTAIPAVAPTLLKDPHIDWASEIVPQKIGCQALKNKGPIFPHGKLLGGSSNLNFMIYMRGCPRDYDNWANLTGDSSWTYDNLLPYFKRMENYEGNFPDDKYHGQGGPLQVSKQLYEPLRDEFLQAGQELGYEIKDPNGYQTESIFPFDTTTKDGMRFSTQRAYLYPAMNRKNLKIQIYSHVTKIHLDEKNSATGVNYVYNGEEHLVKASKEVILSAGVFGSSRILMLSGIGPNDHLKSMGIPVRVNLPVGQGLQDHQWSLIGPFVVEDGKSFSPNRDLNMDALREYVETKGGTFSSMAMPGGAMLASSLTTPSWPDIYFTILPSDTSEASAKAMEAVYGLETGILQRYFKADYGKDAFFVISTLAVPRSRGEVKLRSTNPLDPVIIDPKYYDVPEDLQIMVEGAKIALKLGNETAAFKSIGAKHTSSLFPGCEGYALASDDYWKCYVTRWTQTMYHYVSTCRMGKGQGDPLAVVDPMLRVIGASGLRVVDGSVLPQVTNANTNIPIIMIAEKASDLIKKSWNLM